MNANSKNNEKHPTVQQSDASLLSSQSDNPIITESINTISLQEIIPIVPLGTDNKVNLVNLGDEASIDERPLNSSPFLMSVAPTDGIADIFLIRHKTQDRQPPFRSTTRPRAPSSRFATSNSNNIGIGLNQNNTIFNPIIQPSSNPPSSVDNPPHHMPSNVFKSRTSCQDLACDSELNAYNNKNDKKHLQHNFPPPIHIKPTPINVNTLHFPSNQQSNAHMPQHDLYSEIDYSNERLQQIPLSPKFTPANGFEQFTPILPKRQTVSTEANNLIQNLFELVSTNHMYTYYDNNEPEYGDGSHHSDLHDSFIDHLTGFVSSANNTQGNFPHPPIASPTTETQSSTTNMLDTILPSKSLTKDQEMFLGISNEGFQEAIQLTSQSNLLMAQRSQQSQQISSALRPANYNIPFANLGTNFTSQQPGRIIDNTVTTYNRNEGTNNPIFDDATNKSTLRRSGDVTGSFNNLLELSEFHNTRQMNHHETIHETGSIKNDFDTTSQSSHETTTIPRTPHRTPKLSRHNHNNQQPPQHHPYPNSSTKQYHHTMMRTIGNDSSSATHPRQQHRRQNTETGLDTTIHPTPPSASTTTTTTTTASAHITTPHINNDQDDHNTNDSSTSLSSPIFDEAPDDVNNFLFCSTDNNNERVLHQSYTFQRPGNNTLTNSSVDTFVNTNSSNNLRPNTGGNPDALSPFIPTSLLTDATQYMSSRENIPLDSSSPLRSQYQKPPPSLLDLLFSPSVFKSGNNAQTDPSPPQKTSQHEAGSFNSSRPSEAASSLDIFSASTFPHPHPKTPSGSLSSPLRFPSHHFLIIASVGEKFASKTKSLLKLCRYLSWIRYSPKMVCVGSHKNMVDLWWQQQQQQQQSILSQQYDPADIECYLRDISLLSAFVEMIEILHHGGSRIIIFDHSHCNLTSRNVFREFLQRLGIQYTLLWTEFQITDENLLHRNVHSYVDGYISDLTKRHEEKHSTTNATLNSNDNNHLAIPHGTDYDSHIALKTDHAIDPTHNPNTCNSNIKTDNLQTKMDQLRQNMLQEILSSIPEYKKSYMSITQDEINDEIQYQQLLLEYRIEFSLQNENHDLYHPSHTTTPVLYTNSECFVKLTNDGQFSETYLTYGWLLTNIVYYLLNLQTSDPFIFFSRHGQSQANLSDLVGTDFGLSSSGLVYAQELGHWLRKYLTIKHERRISKALLLQQQQQKEQQQPPQQEKEEDKEPTTVESSSRNTNPIPHIDLTIFSSTLNRASTTAKVVYDELSFGCIQKPYPPGFNIESSSFYKNNQQLSRELCQYYQNKYGHPSPVNSPLLSHIPIRPHTSNNKPRFDINVIKWRALSEIDAGIFDGLSYHEIRSLDPIGYKTRNEDKLNYKYKRGESYKDVIDRLQRVIFELERVQTNPQHHDSCASGISPNLAPSQPKILVIAHQAVIRCLIGYFLNTELDEIPHVEVPLNHIICLKTDTYPAKASIFHISQVIHDDIEELNGQK